MRTISLLALLLLLTACHRMPSSNRSAGSKSPARDAGSTSGGAPASGPEITEVQLGVPLYPGATKVEYSNLVMKSNGLTTYTQYLLTDDDVAKVAEFYRAEALKVGTITDTPMNDASDRLKIIPIELSDGRHCQVQAVKGNDGKTQIHIVTADRRK